MITIFKLGCALKVRRSEMGVTQTKLAKLSGLSRATVNAIERGLAKDLSLTRAWKAKHQGTGADIRIEGQRIGAYESSEAQAVHRMKAALSD